MPNEADPVAGRRGAGNLRHNHIVVLCARTPHEVLVIGADPALVHAVAAALDLT
jgi:hypothetical protein